MYSQPAISFTLDRVNDASDHITFLPLKSLFDPIDGPCWTDLAVNIQDWLFSTVDPQSQEWMWGHKLFWMALIAAYPTILQGPWLYWHPKTSVEWTFIQDCLNKARTGVEEHEFEDVSILHKDIWEQFCQAVS